MPPGPAPPRAQPYATTHPDPCSPTRLALCSPTCDAAAAWPASGTALKLDEVPAQIRKGVRVSLVVASSPSPSPYPNPNPSPYPNPNPNPNPNPHPNPNPNPNQVVEASGRQLEKHVVPRMWDQRNPHSLLGCQIVDSCPLEFTPHPG